MKYRKSIFCSVFSFLLLFLGITGGIYGATGSPAYAAQSRERADAKILRFAVHVSTMGKLDPHFAAASQDRAFADMVFNGLLRYQPGNAPHIEPDLAESIPEFEMVGGRQVWTLKLRQGAMFHPGPQTAAYELSADDVIYSLRKASDKTLSAYAGAYAGMTFEKAGRYQVTITLEKPVSAILFLPKLANYAGGFIVSKKAIETMGYESFVKHPIGTGPFKFKEHRPGKKIVLAAHDRYFRGRPLLNGVELHLLSEIADREAALRSGAMDVITAHGQVGWLERIEQMPNVKIDTYGVGEVVTVYFNTRLKPLHDKRVRRALAYAMDREAFIKTTARGLVGRAYSPVPVQFLPGGLKRGEVEHLDLDYGLDLARARKLLAEAGYPDGFVLNLVSSEKRIYRRSYEVLRDQLARIGVECTIRVVTHSKMHKEIRKSQLPIVIYAAWRPNADAYLTRFFHSDSIIISGAKPDTNFAHYDKIDKLIEAARLAIDPVKQITLWSQAQVRILSDMVAFPAIYIKQIVIRKSYVDYGHDLSSTMALYPQFTEKTRFIANP